MADQIKVNDKVETCKGKPIVDLDLNALDLLKSAAPQSHADSSRVACTMALCWELEPDRK
ncbi:MAG TPA: hypothetical protein V6C86_25360 [Oculatellaceae cyanobacterium]